MKRIEAHYHYYKTYKGTLSLLQNEQRYIITIVITSPLYRCSLMLPYVTLALSLLWRPLTQWFSSWASRPQRCCEQFLKGSRVDILCALLHYICFVRVSDGGRYSLGYSGLL